MEDKKSRFQTRVLKKLNASGVPPFLFVGSGISRRYINTPTWAALMEEFVKYYPECFDKEYGYYSSVTENDLLKVASNLADIFHEYWWSNTQFIESREKYKLISSKSKEMPFKIELCNLLKDKVSKVEGLENELALFSRAVISGMLTTNWDSLLENTFKTFTPRIGQKEVIFNDQKKFAEIFKIHGCISKPDSLIVTENDYDQFINKNHYLNSKILTLLVDFPIVFMGYSLSDKNIEKIISNLIECLKQELIQEDVLKDRLFFVEWSQDICEPKIESSTYSLNSVSIPIQKIILHDYSDILDVLSKVKRSIPIDVLKQLESMVYEFVMTTKPSKKVYVSGLDSLDKIENLEVVVGFGNISKLQEKGVVGLKDVDLIKDILFDDISHENYQEIVENLLPSIVRKNVYIPFFKYQKFAENLNFDNSLKDFVGNYDTLRFAQNITIEDYRLKKQKNRIGNIIIDIKSLNELFERFELKKCLEYIPYFDLDKSQLSVLREFLKNNWDNIDSKDAAFSNFRKCVCLLDYLENTFKQVI